MYFLEITNAKGEKITIENDNIASLNVIFDSSESDDFILGGAIPAEFQATIFNDKDQFQNFKFFGSTIQLWNQNWKQLGKFICSNPIIDEYMIKLEGNDFLANADTIWNGAVFPLTQWELLLNICNQLNLTLNVNKEDLPCANVIIQSSDGIKGKTCRSLIRYIAEANGMFAFMNGAGFLEFKKYDFNKVVKEIKFKDVDTLEVEEMKTFRDGVRIDKDKHGGGTSSYLEIKDNPILSNLSDHDIQYSTQKIYEQIKGMEYYATNLKTWDEKNDLWLGDFYTVENIRGEIIPSIVMQISINSDETINYQSFGDSFEKKQNEAIEESGNIIESFDEEVDFGKTNNGMRIQAKEGLFTICEKKIDNVSKFTRVFLCASGRFTYTSGKEATFEIYADNIKIKEFKVLSRGTQDFSFSFMADTRQAKSNVYSLKVKVNNGEEIDIKPFGIELAILVKSGEIDDIQATDQLLIEKVNWFDISSLNFRKLEVGFIQDYVQCGAPVIIGGPWDISLNQDGSVMATLYDNGELKIIGDNVSKMKTLQAEPITMEEFDISSIPWLVEGFGEQIIKITFKDCFNVDMIFNCSEEDNRTTKYCLLYYHPNLTKIVFDNVQSSECDDFRYFKNDVSIYFANDICHFSNFLLTNTKIENETLIFDNPVCMFGMLDYSEGYEHLSNLKYIYIDNLLYFDYSCCANNKTLEGVFVKNVVDGEVEKIRSYSFQNCNNLSMFTLDYNNTNSFVIDYRDCLSEFYLGSYVGSETFDNTNISDIYINNLEVTLTIGNYITYLKWVFATSDYSSNTFTSSNTTLHLPQTTIDRATINKIKNKYGFIDVTAFNILE